MIKAYSIPGILIWSLNWLKAFSVVMFQSDYWANRCIKHELEFRMNKDIDENSTTESIVDSNGNIR